MHYVHFSPLPYVTHQNCGSSDTMVSTIIMSWMLTVAKALVA